MIRIFDESVAMGTRIPMDILIEIITSDVMIVIIENNYNILEDGKKEFVNAGIDLAVASNYFLAGSSIRPVFHIIETDLGQFNPNESVIIEVNNSYYDILNKKFNAVADSVCYPIEDTNVGARCRIIRDEIKRIYMENYVNKGVQNGI